MLARTVYHCTISSARQPVAIRRLKKEVKQIKEFLNRESVTRSNGKLATINVSVNTAIATVPGNI